MTTYEATASKRSEDVDSEHSNVGSGSTLFFAPFLQLDTLYVFESDSGVNRSVDDTSTDVHADSDGGVVGGKHSVPFGELVDLQQSEIFQRCFTTSSERRGRGEKRREKTKGGVRAPRGEIRDGDGTMKLESHLNFAEFSDV